jgi:hypothetical protein
VDERLGQRAVGGRGLVYERHLVVAEVFVL